MMVRRIAASLLSSALVLAITPASLHAQPKPGHLDEVLRQMDAASLKFQSAQADFRWDLYERVVKETTTQTGTIYFKKLGTTTVMGAKLVTPTIKLIEFRNGPGGRDDRGRPDSQAGSGHQGSRRSQ